MVSSPLNNRIRMDTLIQRGGGTGPVKPRQPTREPVWCQVRQSKILEDERGSAIVVCLPLLVQKRQFHLNIAQRAERK
jgi:hypothetical protein